MLSMQESAKLMLDITLICILPCHRYQRNRLQFDQVRFSNIFNQGIRKENYTGRFFQKLVKNILFIKMSKLFSYPTNLTHSETFKFKQESYRDTQRFRLVKKHLSIEII